ncbi:MAG: PAS domain S-box protein [Polaromonas sp.]|nr:PAS domain S-box protein [Polaromonas sp.]
MRSHLVLVVLAAMLPLLAWALIKAVIDQRAAVAMAATQLEIAAARVVASQDRIALSARSMLLGIASTPGLLSLPQAECQRYFKRLNAGLPAYSNLGLADADGRSRCHGVNDSAEMFIGDREYFKAAMQRRDFVVGGYSIGRATGQAKLTFALPVLSEGQPPMALVFASMEVREFSKMMEEVPLPAGGQMLVTDHAGIVLAAIGTTSVQVGQPRPTGVSVAPVPASGGDEGRIFSVRASGPTYAPDFYVVVSADRRGILAQGRMDLAEQLIALALAGLFGSALAWRIGGRAIVHPAQELLTAHQQIQEGRRQVRVAARSNGAGSEFLRIGEGFNRMAESLDERDQALAQRDHALKAELQRSLNVQRRLQGAQRIGRIGNWEVDLATGALWWSDEVYALFGLRPDNFECTWANFLRQVHPADRPRFEAQRDLAVAAAAELDIEYRIITPQGEVRWIHHVSQPHVQPGEAGESTRRVGVMQEITDRKQAALALAEGADLQRRTGEMAQIGGWQLNLLDMQFTSSEQVLRIYRHDPLMPLGHAAAMAGFGPEGADSRIAIERAFEAAREHGVPWDLELPLTTAGGATVWVRTQGRAVAENGQIVRLVGALQDITARKMADRAALESEQRYSALFASAPVPMWVFDRDTLGFLAVNDAAARAYGYTQEEFLRMSLFDIRPESNHDALRLHMGQTLGLGRQVWTHRRRDGSVFPVDVVARPISHDGRAARFVVALDLTVQRQAEAAMQAHLAMLQRAADAAQAITWHRTLRGLLQEVVEQARGVIGSHRARVWLSESNAPTGGQQAWSASPGQNESAAEPRPASPAWRELFRPVLEHNRSVRLTPAIIAAQLPQQSGLQPLTAGTASVGTLAVPLLGRSGANIGLLQLSAKYDGDFTQQD